MKREFFTFIIFLTFLIPAASYARGGGTSHKSRSDHSLSHTHDSHSRKSYSSTNKQKRSTRAQGVARDNNGRIKRSVASKKEFMRQTGYAHGRPGYVVDHVESLKRGGADSPSNMQWQTKEAAKAKDKWE